MVEAEKQKKFREMDMEERFDYLRRNSGLTEHGEQVLRDWKNNAPKETENHIGYMVLPIGLVKIRVNQKIYGVPMATEEPSVVAAASHGAKMAEKTGGFKTQVIGTGTITTGQIQIIDIPSDRFEAAIQKVIDYIPQLVEVGNIASPRLIAAGGGIVSIKPKSIYVKMRQSVPGADHRQLIIDFDVECKDAMGANAVSKMAEAMAKPIESLTGGKAVGRILSNLSLGRLVICEAEFDKEAIGLRKEINGSVIEIPANEMIRNIIALNDWAAIDQFRTTTHNKGIMNGITAVALALGQDTRAIESAAHSYAAYGGRSYQPLSHFEILGNGNLYGCLSVPIPVGLVSGVIDSNPTAKALIEITGCNDARELASLHAAVGLAQNISALRMLAGEGISKGHMPLHHLRTSSS